MVDQLNRDNKKKTKLKKFPPVEKGGVVDVPGQEVKAPELPPLKKKRRRRRKKPAITPPPVELKVSATEEKKTVPAVAKPKKRRRRRSKKSEAEKESLLRKKSDSNQKSELVVEKEDSVVSEPAEEDLEIDSNQEVNEEAKPLDEEASEEVNEEEAKPLEEPSEESLEGLPPEEPSLLSLQEEDAAESAVSVEEPESQPAPKVFDDENKPESSAPAADMSAEEQDVPDWLKAVPNYSYSVEEDKPPVNHVGLIHEENYPLSGVPAAPAQPSVFDRHYQENLPEEDELQENLSDNAADSQQVNKGRRVIDEELHTDLLTHQESRLEKMRDFVLDNAFVLRKWGKLAVRLAGLFLLVVVVWYVIANWSDWRGGEESTKPVPVSLATGIPTPIPTPIQTPLGQEPLAEKFAGLAAGEEIGYFLPGQPLRVPGKSSGNSLVPVTGVETGAGLGELYLRELNTDFQQKIFTLREMQNTFEADIYALMDVSGDRYAVLQNQINLMKLLEQKATLNMEQLTAQTAELQNRFNQAASEKQTAERIFFVRLKELNPLAADESLSHFVKLAHVYDDLKANLNARAKVLNYHGLILENLRNRRRDYELNFDALVKGVKVVDVKNSDINLILPDA